MNRIPAAVRKKAEVIKLLLLDVDGVLTDGAIIVNDRGVETKHFHVRDGQGIALLVMAGVQVGLITGRSSKAVGLRAQELGIKLVYQGRRNKLHAYEAIKKKTGLSDAEIAYVGDDIVDLPVLARSGLAVAVADSWSGLRTKVDYVTRQPGGKGAVREVCELLLRAQGRYASLAQTRGTR
ncbi:MAG TPA: HAD-IIIA family hydrolase [Candidatus Eisenbacteria bacterium]|nr:HAD-IIIA family hydrolase [Candidatus Eisenbacteria bacterium]